MASVLIVQNEPLVASELADAVTAIGHTVVGTARNRDQAIRIAANMRPDVALVDYRLGDVEDGVAVVLRLRQIGAKVIYMTATSGEVRLIDATAEVVPKPFGQDMLQRALKRVIRPA